MRRLSLGVLFLMVAGSLAAVAMVRAWASDPPPASAEDGSDIFGDDAKPAPAAKSSSAKAESATPSEDAPPPGLRPYAPEPSKPVNPSRANESGGGHIGINSAVPSLDRILTPAMAVSPEPPAPIDVLSAPANAAMAKINAALASTTEFDFKVTPLNEVVELLKKRHKIEIQLDAAGLKDAGVEPSTPVTRHMSGISLRSALRLMLDELQLKYVVHDEILLITSPQKNESDEYMVTRFYPVKDLVLVRNEHGEIETDFQPLRDLITKTVEQKSWLDNGGTGAVYPYVVQDRCLLIINQTQDVHEEVVYLLATLRKAGNVLPKDAKDLRMPQLPKPAAKNGPIDNKLKPANPAPATGAGSTGMPASILAGVGFASPPASGAGAQAGPDGLVRILTPEMAQTREPPTIDDALGSPAVAKIKAALDSPTEIDCDKTPLRQVMEQLAKRHKIEIQIDQAGLKDAGVDEETPITKHLSGISLGAALRNLLNELQLKYVIHNEVLLITSPQKAESDEFMITTVYPVKAFVLVKNDRGEIETDFETLIDMLTNTVEQKTWLDNGGTGTITAFQFQDRCLLVVSQTTEVQEEIAQFLSALHRAAASEGTKEGELHLPQLPDAASSTTPTTTSSPAQQGGGMF